MIGDTVEALRAFHEVVDPKVRRVALIDTLQDEKFEAIRVAEALGKDLYAVRLDTPSSRRGRLLPDPRRGALGARLPRLRAREDPGLGRHRRVRDPEAEPAGATATAWAPPSPTPPCCRFALDIMEIEGAPMAKRGKRSGAKQVWRAPGQRAQHRAPRPQAGAGGTRRPPRRGAAQAARRRRAHRARPAAAAHHPRLRPRADGAHRDPAGAGARPCAATTRRRSMRDARTLQPPSAERLFAALGRWHRRW